jgi:MFS family permease
MPIAGKDGIFGPLHYPTFRRIWVASMFSNLGQLVQAVGAAWAMTELTHRADQVALVQSAAMLPILLLAMAAGAAADMFDRRRVCIGALLLVLVGAGALSTIALLGQLSPMLILICCFVVGSGMALFGPAWQASVAEQVPTTVLHAAIALNSMSYNIARSLGPAIGGLIIASIGTSAAFLANVVLVLPLLLALVRWQRPAEPSRLPPERMSRAIMSGLRYIAHAPNIRIVLMRSALTTAIGGALVALMPIVVRDLLGGDATIYGLMLGAFGAGAVAGALNMQRLRRWAMETSLRGGAALFGLAAVATAASRSPWLTAPALFCAGASWTVMVSLLNVSIQLAAPRWVAGRTLASYQAAIAGGIAFGSFFWGRVADAEGISAALYMNGAAMVSVLLLGRYLTVPEVAPDSARVPHHPADVVVNLDLTPRSGPVIIEIEYRVAADRAREFYGVMLEVQLSRQRTGAYGWSIARDITDPDLWTERYHCPTWHDYLRQRSRSTRADHELHLRAAAFQTDPGPTRIRRMLERPYGSVRWREEVKDRAALPVLPLSSG